MKNYSFKTLNDKEFEALAGDLLSKELGYEFQSFKSGKDKGIDLRYSTNIDNKIVVQVKHYANSSYAQLKSQFKNKELDKIKALNPQRYIVVTSLELNPSETEEIKEILHPFVKSINDIYWNQRLNSLLSKYEEIERNNFKLWFSSTSVLNNILNNSSYLKSAYLKEEIENKISHYVQTDFHSKALEILKSNKVLLITGAPGVGKTTLAQMLTFDFINQGFQHLVIEDKISDAEDLLSPDKETKQIVYFDDFLGSNIYEILNPRNSENALTRFISRIQNTPNKYLILTTRTTILNQALAAYEKIRYKKLHTSSKFEIYINDYSILHKAEILYNHIYFGDISSDYRTQIFEDKNYLKIIQHKNYNPRLIEFFTSKIHINDISPKSYLTHILDNLNNPEEIWRNSFERQLCDEDRFLLLTLLSLRGDCSIQKLEQTYNVRIKSEISNYGYKLIHNSFNNSIKNLEGSYLKTTMSHHDGTSISFINPSISDFLINYLRKSKSEITRLFQGVAFLHQITNLFHPSLKDYINYDSSQSLDFYNLLVKRELEISQNYEIESFNLEFLRILLKLFPKSCKKNDLIRLFKELSPRANASKLRCDSKILIL